MSRILQVGPRCKDGSLTSLFLQPFQMYFVSTRKANVLEIQTQRMCRIQTNDMLAVYMLMVMNVEEEEEKKAAGKSVDACFFRLLS